MTQEVSDILKKALALPPEARAALAGSLLESLNESPQDERVAAAWSDEIKRRIDEIDSGKVQMIPYEEVRRRLAARLSDAAKKAVPLSSRCLAGIRNCRRLVPAT